MDNKDVHIFAEQYFSSQNFLNKKILQDISSVRDSIPIEKWEKLTFMDREKVKFYFYDKRMYFYFIRACYLKMTFNLTYFQVIDENIIRSDVQAKYRQKSSEAKTSFLSFPKLKQRTGQKFVVEENNSADGKVYNNNKLIL